jgi:predicted nucleic-acid-binding Zn-ribbon protein
VIVIDPARILNTNKKAMKNWKEKTQGEQGAQTETGKNKRERRRSGRIESTLFEISVVQFNSQTCEPCRYPLIWAKSI